MAVPKRRVSSQRRDTRRAHWKLEVPGMIECPNCKAYKMPHKICGECGYYNGREVIKMES